MTTSEENNKEITSEQEEFDKVKVSAWESVKRFFSELLDIRSETDRDATIESVKHDISFKGHTAWILIFSIFVASIGLNVSSTAVVIGAMLISPLMGPIVGLGMSVAINDVETLRRSLINLGVMVVLSVLTAFLYFKMSPLTKETPELLARTTPTILDVLVAIFGGLALIVAKTKKGTIASVIFGVAIATALMPPLCTVGYGLAIGNASYAGGAMYLFSINAVFIALTTFIVAKVLGFPLVRYANSRRRKLTARLASLIALIVMVPSIFIFIGLYKQQVFDSNASDFVENILQFDGAEVVKFTHDFETKDLDIYFIGRVIPADKINEWNEKLKENEVLKDCKLSIYQGADQSIELADRLSGQVKAGILEDLYVKNENLIRDKDDRIQFLENEIANLKVNEFDFKSLTDEVKILYSDVESFSYSKRITTNFTKTDTLPVFYVTWNKDVKSKKKTEELIKLDKWLRFQLELDTLKILDTPK
ncbi:DUF389 domain-containing protein [Candidatus Marifrigoribacter sp. Uisw_064]|uniref:DUF389 domain-containing protein n=1 Tax=Candidatus Marifrigoribacter sp. Uisw_064 TaxID=3230970 RepID=UPI003D4872E2